MFLARCAENDLDLALAHQGPESLKLRQLGRLEVESAALEGPQDLKKRGRAAVAKEQQLVRPLPDEFLDRANPGLGQLIDHSSRQSEIVDLFSRSKAQAAV